MHFSETRKKLVSLTAAEYGPTYVST